MIRSATAGRAVGLALLLSAAPAAFAQGLPGGERNLTLPPSLRSPSAPEPAARPAPEPARPAPQPSRPAAQREKPQPTRPPAQARPAQPPARPPAQARPAQPTPPAAVQPAVPAAVAAPPAAPARPPAAAAPPAATEARAEPAPLTPERLRPSPDNVLDCKDAPKTAVTQVPAEIARWATVYCLKSGHVFTTNDRYFARFPRTPVLGRFNAAEMTGRADNLGHAAHFTRIAYAPLPKAEADALIAAADPTNAAFLRGKDLFRLDLAVDTGQSFAMVLIDPGKDPFWVLTLAEGKPAKSFFVASLDHMNQRR